MILIGSELLRNDVYETSFTTKSDNRLLLAIADGMGGHNCGEVASEDALTNLRFFFDDLPLNMSEGELRQAMDNWLKSMCLAVEAKGKEDPIYRGMGTTLVAMLYYSGQYYWINCGDSRLYRLHQGELLQLTTDHSLINTNSIKKHSNVITNCIGAGIRQPYLDLFEFTDDFLSGDTYMLCSDGLNDMISDKRIAELMVEGANANLLCEAAIEAGGYDNVSVCVFTVEPLT
jgi:protein phosphatase